MAPTVPPHLEEEEEEVEDGDKTGRFEHSHNVNCTAIFHLFLDCGRKHKYPEKTNEELHKGRSGSFFPPCGL